MSESIIDHFDVISDFHDGREGMGLMVGYMDGASLSVCLRVFILLSVCRSG